jgi:hypothetical protein
MSEYNDDVDIELEGVDSLDIEIEDDTPEADRNRSPMPKELVDELEADELEDYSDKVKTRLKQMKKVWHDERREKEQASRERQEALNVAQNMLEENRRLKKTLSEGEQTLVHSFKQSTEMEAAQARREYKQAYEAGDSDALVEAQEKLAKANYKLEQLNGYRPSLQEEQPVVQQVQDSAPIPRPDRKTEAWQERNSWWGVDPEMTASALGLHQKLEKQNGANYVGTDEYWNSIDNTMRRRFPEYFGDNDTPTASPTRTSRPATVVAPASRSTSSRKVVLKQSQLTIAKKLGVTPEQYAREFLKVEK